MGTGLAAGNLAVADPCFLFVTSKYLKPEKRLDAQANP
jgi:hypothetical protein